VEWFSDGRSTVLPEFKRGEGQVSRPANRGMVVDLRPFTWYKPIAVKSTATHALETRLALDATYGRGSLTAYYWRFS
jgi:hypothetical protein